MAAVMIKLNTRARALATTAPLALVLGLLAAFTMGYIPDHQDGQSYCGRCEKPFEPLLAETYCPVCIAFA